MLARMPILRAVITDADGRRVPLVPLERLGVESERRRRFDRARRHPAPRPDRADFMRGVGYGVLALPVLLAAALAPVYVAFQWPAPWWGRIVAMLPMTVLPAVVTIWLVRRVAGERIARLYVLAGYCASCGYDLEATAERPDGVRLCPECGAGWRIPIKDRP